MTPSLTLALNSVSTSFSCYEVSGYVSMTQHFRPPGIVAISEAALDGLTAEQQTVLGDEAAALQDYEVQLTEEVGQAALEELKAKGMAINDADVASFRDRMRPVYPDFTEKHRADLLAQVQNTQ